MINLLQKHQILLILCLIVIAGCRQVTTYEYEVMVQDATTDDPITNAAVRAEMGIRDFTESITADNGIAKLAVDDIYQDVWIKVIIEADGYEQQSFLAKLDQNNPATLLKLQAPAAETDSEQSTTEETASLDETTSNAEGPPETPPTTEASADETVPTETAGDETASETETAADEAASETGTETDETASDAETAANETASDEAPPGELAALAPSERADYYKAKPELTIDPAKSYQATIKTSKGDIVLSLDATAAPEHVNNFIFLSNQGFYDGLTFHRVEPDFVIQGGDPQGAGTGGPGYTVPAEFNLTHDEGALAMARQPDEVNPEQASSGSQFYITLTPTHFLDGDYSVFGQVESGMDVVQSIAIGDLIERVIVETN